MFSFFSSYIVLISQTISSMYTAFNTFSTHAFGSGCDTHVPYLLVDSLFTAAAPGEDRAKSK